jgi:glycosyltransferase involved in cell wall biosynthesis
MLGPSQAVSPARTRLLVLTPRFPYPVVGGDRLRIYQACKELAKDHELTLLSLCDSPVEMTMQVPADGVFKRIERIWLPKWKSALNVAASLFTSMPLQVAYYRSPTMAKRIAQLLPDHDACLAHLIRTGHYVMDAQVPTILEMTDAISLNYQRVREVGSRRGLRYWIYRVEADRLLRYERMALDRFDCVCLVSPVDRQFLLNGQNKDHVLVSSQGVDTDALPFRERHGSDSPVIAFIGNINSMQNLDACLSFGQHVMPLLRQKIDCRFRVVGRIQERDKARLLQMPGVEVTGDVDSVAAAVSDARLGVAPVRLGAGVQNKVLEYMALGLPVISSSIAMEGLAAKPDEDVLVADSPEQIAQTILGLWNDSARRKSLAERGRAYVQEHHAWPAQLAPLRSACQKLVSTAQASE